MRLNVRFAGAGGQGVILASVLLAKGYGLGENYKDVYKRQSTHSMKGCPLDFVM